MKKFEIEIRLTILGPFLTATASPEVYGLQKAFYRGPDRQPALPGSHVKGKLRMALDELLSTGVSGLSIDKKDWFGDESSEQSYAPVPGRLRFSDFSLVIQARPAPREAELALPARRSRVTIHPRAMTAAENKLRDVEELFASGASTEWVGSVTFYARDLAEAGQIQAGLLAGFRWLTALGAEKGVGFGRLRRVQVGVPQERKGGAVLPSHLGTAESLHLRIRPVERLLIGEVKKPRANYVPTGKVIPGGAVKGALAATLNRAHGLDPSRPLSAESGNLMPDFRELAAHFDQVRITHAFPAIAGNPRAVRLPISTTFCDERWQDRALASDPLVNGHAPAFFYDGKEMKEYAGAASPKEVFVTRTEIDDVSRRSREGRLFTYSFLRPVDHQDRPVEWVCNVDFSAIADPAVQRQVRDQFALAVMRLDGLGKLNLAVEVAVAAGPAAAALPSRGPVQAGEALVTLQTDALMLDPEDVRALAPGKDLFELYAAYWREIGGQAGLELSDFWAYQTFQGGYLYHRYLGAVEREERPNAYYPYYLTGAGSLFRLRATTPQAGQLLQRWLAGGLPLPGWAVQRYTRDGHALWKTCPFVPQNGYGEIAVNLDWHWNPAAL